MTMSDGGNGGRQRPPTVLVVEDERGLANLYSIWLSEFYDVRTAYDGLEALELLDDDVDVVLLDRRLPEMMGTAVLREIRDRGYDCQVSLVTAVPPDEEIADLPIDDYLTKPIEHERIKEAVDELLLRSNEDTGKQELLGLISRKIALEQEHGQDNLEDSQKYTRLTQRIEELLDRLDVTSQRISSKYRPTACPNCGLRWDVNIEDTVGFIPLSSYAWKCIQCGEVVRISGPNDRRIARR